MKKMLPVFLLLLAACSGDTSKNQKTGNDTAAPADTAAKPSVPQPPEDVNATGKYQHTYFLYRPDARLDTVHNYVYSPGPALVMEELYRYNGLKYKGYSAKTDIGSDAYIAICGKPDSVINRVEQEFREKFGRSNIVSCPDGATVMSYGYVYKQSEYRVPLDDYAMKFKGKQVDAFAVKGSGSGNSQADQVKVRWYSTEKDYFFDKGDFIVQLLTEKGKDEIYIACIRPEATLKTTYDKAWRTIQKPPVQQSNGGGVKFPMGLTQSSYLAAPDLLVQQRQDSSFFLPLLNQTEPKQMYSRRDFFFHIDEKGAKLTDSIAMYDSIGRGNFRLPPLIVNRSYLLIMKESGRENPYLLMWINDPELMPAAKKD